MQLSSKAINSFKRIYINRYGIELQDYEAEKKASQFLNFFKLIYRLVPATNKAELEGYRTA